MKDLILFAGPNGSGKSTVRDVIPNPVEVVIDPDRIARAINPDDPRSVDAAAAREAVRRFDQALAEGRSVSMETTLTGHTAVQRLRRAKEAGYDVSLIYVALADPELNVARVAARVRKGGHFIDPEVTRQRVRNSLDNLPAAVAIADRALVIDNSGPLHRRVLETADRRVTFLSDQLPGWLEAAMPAIVAGLQPAPTASARIGPAKRPALTGIFDALRAPLSASPLLETTPQGSMAERLAAFQAMAAARKPPAGPAPDSEPSPEFRPSRGPRPG